MGHSVVTPNIMCSGKTLSGGVVPCSAFSSTAKIWEAMEPNPFIHTTIASGNPLACAAALVAVEVMLEEDTPSQDADKGKLITERLNELRGKYPELLAGGAGAGLPVGMRFASSEVGYRVASALFQRRALTAGTLISSESIRVEPALNIPSELLGEAQGRLEDAMEEVSSEVPPQGGTEAVAGRRLGTFDCVGAGGCGYKCRA